MPEMNADDGAGKYRNVPINPPPNSHKIRDAKEEKPEKPQKDIKQVTKTAAKTRKKPLTKKIREAFIADDAKTVGEFLIIDVLIPSLQTMIVNMGQQGIERVIFGDSRPNNRLRAGLRTDAPGYTRYHQGPVPSRPAVGASRAPASRQIGSRAQEAHDFDQIVIESRGEAEEVLERLGDLVVEYDTVTLGELYRMVGITPSFVDDRWGWTDLRGAHTQRVSNGYVLVLPPATYLD